MGIPKIIHQIWSGIDGPLPEYFRILGETWKKTYPDWEYIQWDNEKMNAFIQEYYPQWWDVYTCFPYNVQRWDAIRYLILYQMGGMYVDFDYESLKPVTQLVDGKECCFALEPDSHRKVFKRPVEQAFNNALMLSVPGHPFMKKIIDGIFAGESPKEEWSSKDMCVLNTTGPWKLMDLYDDLSPREQEDIYLIPAKYVTPFDVPQAFRVRAGEESDELEKCLDEAYAVHYFFGNWRFDNR